MPPPAIKQAMGPLEWTMLIVLSLIWGGSFFLFAVALRGLPVFTIVAFRVVLASAALWLVALALGHRPPNSLGAWRNFFIMGLLNNAVPFSLIVWGQTRIASGLAAILNATTPFFGVLIANALTRDEKLSTSRLIGSLIGLAGVALMIGLDVLETLDQHLLAELAVIGAAMFYASAGVFGRRFAGSPPIVTAAGQTTGSSLLILPFVLVIDQPWTLAAPSATVWTAVICLALVCTAFAYILYFSILQRSGATNVLLVTFLVPVSAIGFGTLFLGETLHARHLFGMGAIGLGLALIDGRLIPRLKALA